MVLQRLQVFTWLEAHGLSRGDIHFGAGSRVPADTGLPGLDGKNAEAAQLNPIVGLERILHTVEDRIDRLFRFCFADSRALNDLIHEIKFDHWDLPLLSVRTAISFVNKFLPPGKALRNAY
jgi:hypothetical protein